MKTNDKPTTCDLETVITAQITIISEERKMPNAELLSRFADRIKDAIGYAVIDSTEVFEFDDERIKVQFFLHEKSKGCE